MANNLSRNEPFVAFGGKVDPLNDIRNAGIITSGDVYWVSNESDSAHRTRHDAIGGGNFAVSVQAGLDKTTDDANDYVMVIPQDDNAVWADADLGAAAGTPLVVSTDRVHLLSVGYGQSVHGYNNTFESFATATGAYDTSLVNVNGAGVEMAGFRILGTTGTSDNGTISAGYLQVGTSGNGTPHNFWAHDMAVENNLGAAATGGTNVIIDISGDVAGGISGLRFDRVWAGNRSWVPAAVINVSGTAGPSRAEVHDSTFVIDAQATTDSFVTWGTGETEYTTFENCRFINVEAGTAPASAIEGALLVDNPLMVVNTIGLNVTELGTDTEAFVAPVSSGTRALLYNTNIASGTAALVAA